MRTETSTKTNGSLYAKQHSAEKVSDMPADCVTVETFMEALRAEIER
jgi:hypothetical protein